MKKQLTVLDRNNHSKMTIKEIANILNVTPRTITRYVEKYFPDLMNHGRVTTLSELQVTKIKLELQKAKNVNGVSEMPKTELEENLIIQQAQDLLLGRITKLQEQIKIQSLQLEEAKPKVESFDTLMKTDELSDIGQSAKMLGTGRNRLFEILRIEKILIKTTSNTSNM